MSDETPLPKQELLIKLMGMTTSANDSEALVAVRKANELLLANKWSWEKLIRGKIRIIEDPFKDITPPAGRSDFTSNRMSTPPKVPPKPPQPQPKDWTHRRNLYSPPPAARPQPAPSPKPAFSYAQAKQYVTRPQKKGPDLDSL